MPFRIANTHACTHSQMGTSVMRSRGIKVKKATVRHSEWGEKRKQEGGRKGSEVGRNVKTKKGRWKAGAGVLRPPGNF